MMKLIKLFILLFVSVIFAQKPDVSGTLKSINEDGLYRIHVPHTVRSYATNNLRDFRIWDAKGNQVPYFIQPATVYKKVDSSDFTKFSIISSEKIADSSSTYIFKNPNKTIEQVGVLIANYQGNKNYRLEGSNNQQQWFGIVNSGHLNQLNHPTETNVYKVINFPLCSYKYVKIVFDDRYSLPINLLKIGNAINYTSTEVAIAMNEIPVKGIDFLEKNKKTQIHIRFERKEVINQIKIAITAPELYSRKATLYTLHEREVKHKVESYRKQLATFDIRSDKELVFDVYSCLEKELYLEIENNDNPKLQINGVQFMQKPIYVVASLKKNVTYTITAGDEKLDLPNYDISSVTGTLKTELPIVQIDSVVYNLPEKAIINKTSFWQQPWFMWCCIGLAALVILYFSFNLIKDLDNNKD